MGSVDGTSVAYIIPLRNNLSGAVNLDAIVKRCRNGIGAVVVRSLSATLRALVESSRKVVPQLLAVLTDLISRPNIGTVAVMLIENFPSAVTFAALLNSRRGEWVRGMIDKPLTIDATHASYDVSMHPVRGGVGAPSASVENLRTVWEISDYDGSVQTNAIARLPILRPALDVGVIRDLAVGGIASRREVGGGFLVRGDGCFHNVSPFDARWIDWWFG